MKFAKQAKASNCVGMVYKNGAAKTFIPGESVSFPSRDCGSVSHGDIVAKERHTLDIGEGRSLSVIAYKISKDQVPLRIGSPLFLHTNASSKRISISSLTFPLN